MGRWSRDDLRAIAKRYDAMLRPSSYPVAVKMIADLAELTEIKDEKGRPPRMLKPSFGDRFAVCQLLAQARYLGRRAAASAETLAVCKPGAVAMGFMEMPEHYPDGYVGSLYTSKEVSRRANSIFPKFELGKYVAMFVSPLEEMITDPDVVLFYVNTAQLMRIINGYLYDKGESLDFTTNGEVGGCSNSIVTPLQTGKPSIAFACNGARVLSWPSDSEVICAVPANILVDVLQGLEFTHQGRVRYPITWQHIDWEPPPGTPLRNVLDGKGYFVKKEV